MPDFSLEASATGHVAGVDEVGRGPLAGPVLAAAVVFLGTPPERLSALLDDSKRLSARSRERADHALRQATAEGLLVFALGAASVTEIGRLNILRASHLAMRRAVQRLPVRPALVLCDGNASPDFGCPVLPVIGGDARSFSIAAASILAKVMRDKVMLRLDKRWPGWGYGTNQGYPTAAHRARLAMMGPTPHHRRGFAPVDQAALRFD
jgi:ribonuclease HII